MPNLAFVPQAILIDVDRTLVNTKMEITPLTQQVLKRVAQAGIKVALCSGRGFVAVKGYVLKKIPLDHTLHILDGGGKIISSQGELKWERPIDEQLVQTIVKTVIESGAYIYLYQDDCLYMSPEKLWKYENHPWNIKVGSILELKNYHACLLSINNLNPQTRQYVHSLQGKVNLKEMTNYEGQRYFDLTAPGVTKETAVKHWAELQNLDLQKVIAFGDSENDIEVIRAVGCGVAMGNAMDILKQRANKVIGDVDQDGLAIYLDELLTQIK